MAAIAYHMNLRIFNWKTNLSGDEYESPVADWPNNQFPLTVQHIDYLASIGYAGTVFGYSTQTGNGVPDAVACWMKEYYLEERPGCELPIPQTGIVPLPNTIEY